MSKCFKDSFSDKLILHSDYDRVKKKIMIGGWYFAVPEIANLPPHFSKTFLDLAIDARRR